MPPLSSSRPAIPKFDNLAALRDVFDVPAMVLLDEEVLTKLFPNLGPVLARTDQLIESISQTFGSFIERDLDALDAVVETLSVSPSAGAALDAILIPDLGKDWRSQRLAVRSAGVAEDLESHSFAGIYTTKLGVTGEAELLAAVLDVWRSGFSRSALVERLAAGELKPGNPVCIIVQAMVDADQAGVAFSTDPLTGRPDCVVEAVSGIGEALVSGEVEGRRATFRHDAAPAELEQEMAHPLWPVAVACREIARRWGKPVDIEWAIEDGVVKLLQVRAITTLDADTTSSTEPVLFWSNLYGDGPDDQFAAYEPLPEFARYFRSKRKRIYDFSFANGLGISAAILFRANANGLRDPDMASRISALFAAPEVIVDISDRIRQIIMPSQTLVEALLGLMPDPERIFTFVVRDFVRGDIGIISEPLPGSDDGVVLEWTADGLLAINRGIADTRNATLHPDGAGGDLPPLDAGNLERLRLATLAAQQSMGPVRLEWVAAGRNLYALDFSAISSGSGPVADGDIIAHGFVEGRAMALEIDEVLHALSVAPSVSLTNIPDARLLGSSVGAILDRIALHDAKPIIVVERPYAALAALLPYTSGFVFERASTLCHLSILLREHGMPAMQSATLFEAARAADYLRIDTHGSGITVMDAPIPPALATEVAT